MPKWDLAIKLLTNSMAPVWDLAMKLVKGLSVVESKISQKDRLAKKTVKGLIKGLTTN